MPTYIFKCNDCRTKYEIYSSIAKYDTCNKDCPKCDSSDVHRVYEDENVCGSVRKGDSEITVGQLADRNRERMSEDQKEDLYQKNNAYKDKELIRESYKDEYRYRNPRKLKQKNKSDKVKVLSDKQLQSKLKGKNAQKNK
jgi:putative FmdB family regulatory protein